MIKKLFFLTALLMAGVAYGADPTADLTVQVVPAGSAPSIPAAAQRAGFTTLAANYDFSQSLYAAQSNWLDCSLSNDSVTWHVDIPGIPSRSCNIFQATDPSTGDTVLRMQYQPSYNSGCAQQCWTSMQTWNDGGSHGFTAFPNGIYMESVYRIDVLSDPGNASGPDGIFTWGTQPGTSGGSGSVILEFDITELWGSSGGFADANADNHNAPLSNAQFYASYRSNNLPSGYSVLAYHKYGMLVTTDGSKTIYVCSFVDDILQGACKEVNGSSTPQVYGIPNRLIIQVGTLGGGNGYISVTKNLYLKYLRIWSCANWAEQMSQQSSAVCKGSTLSNSSGLTYWH